MLVPLAPSPGISRWTTPSAPPPTTTSRVSTTDAAAAAAGDAAGAAVAVAAADEEAETATTSRPADPGSIPTRYEKESFGRVLMYQILRNDTVAKTDRVI